MGDWYTIGAVLGVAVGFGVILAGLLAASRVGALAATVFGAVGGVGFGLPFEDIAEIVAGGIGGALGAACAAVVVLGAMRRGATRLGVAANVGGVGILLMLLAAIPIVGYVLALVFPFLAARMRGRQAARFAGLRTLAK